MKVISAINTSKPSDSAYTDVDVVMIINRHGYTFAITQSHNALINCYILCEYSTGRGLSAFGLPLDMQDSDVDRVVERANEHLDKNTPESIKLHVTRFPVMNEDVPDESEAPDYSDVKIKQKIKEQNEKTIMEKFEEKTKPVVKKKVVKEKVSAIKKKRGRPKKVVKEDNILF